MSRWVWLPILALVVVAQTVALTDDVPSNTLSAQWRWLRDSLPQPLPHVVVIVTAVGLGWWFAHWIIDRRRHEETL